MTDKAKILAETERLKNTAEDYIAQGGVDCICARGNVEMADDIIKFINSLPEEPVSIWHDVNQQPEINTTILVRTYDNIVESTKRYDDNLIPWEDRIKRDGITHWCYVEDLLKL